MDVDEGAAIGRSTVTVAQKGVEIVWAHELRLERPRARPVSHCQRVYQGSSLPRTIRNEAFT